MTDYSCPYCNTFKKELSSLLERISFLEKGIEAYRYLRSGNSQFADTWEAESRTRTVPDVYEGR